MLTPFLKLHSILPGLCIGLLASTAHAQIEVLDDFGTPVRLNQPAQRIISLAPHITETLFAAGAGDRIVATVQYSDFPPEATGIPVIGSSSEISFETIVTLNPDLVIVWVSGNGEEVASRISSLGFAVYRDEPRTLQDIARAISNFGMLAGTSDIAAVAAEDFRARLARLQSRTDNQRKSKTGNQQSRTDSQQKSNTNGQQNVRVFYEIWDSPLTTLNGGHLISSIIELCGGVNIFADAIPVAPVVSIESVLTADPQLIVVSGMDQEDTQSLDKWTRWPGLTAAETGNIRFIPPDLLQRSAPRIIEGAELMCEFVASTAASN